MLMTKAQLEEIFDDIENSSIFDKFSTKQKISLKTLQQAITTPMDVYNSSLKMFCLFMVACPVITAGYFGLLSAIRAFDINSFVTIALMLSMVGVFYGSAHCLIRFLHVKKIFKFQKEDLEAKTLFETFLNSDTDELIAQLKEEFFEKLDKLDIKQYNPAVYDYIDHNISNLDSKFNKLKYEIEQSVERDKYSFQPFRDFFSEVQNIETSLEGAKDIKIINE